MSHYAKVIDGKVTQVIVAEADFINTQEGQWIQTSYNTHANQHTNGGAPLRGNYAGIGFIYDEVNDVFYAPQLHASWILDQSDWTWKAPVAKPTDGKQYNWDEPTTSWVEFTSSKG